MESKSPRFRFDRVDAIKTLRFYGIAFIGFFATVILASLPAIQDAVINTLSESTISPVVLSVVLAIIPSLFEAIRRFLTDHSK